MLPPSVAPPQQTAVAVTCLLAQSERVHAAAAVLSATERQRARRFVFARDRRRFIVARGFLREVLAARLNVEPQSVELAVGPGGKPGLAAAFADSHLRFNLSHCDDIAVVAVSHGRDVGVDVEAIRAMPDADDLATRFFSVREQEAYRALDPRDKPLGFFQCWTRKEAFVKALGDGLSYPLDAFDVSLAPGEPACLFRADGWRVESFTPAPRYVAAVVTEDRETGY